MVSVALIVGLGNPGPRYITTRHNAGFWLVDNLAVQKDVQFRQEAKFFGEVCRVEQGDLKYWLLKPNTFMNHSGQAVAALASYYKISIDQILVIHDDLDFPTGTVRLKKGGGDGRHNGLKDIIAKLGSPQFLRLRIGIGHPGFSRDVVNYVLSPPTRDEQRAIEGAISVALDMIPHILIGELNKVMQQLHTYT